MFTPPPVASQEPTPVVNKTVVAKEVSGRVRIRCPARTGSSSSTRRRASRSARPSTPSAASSSSTSIPKAGRRAAEGAVPRRASSCVTQSRGITDLKLTEALARCPKRGARAAAKKPKSRKLWGKGSGEFRTTGNYSAATVRGTEWLVQDTCAGTLTRVRQGAVSVRDKVKKRTIIVRAGKRYLARPRR